MRSEPNRRTAVELKDQLVQANRAYRDGKEKLVERSVTSLESKTKLIFPLLFFGVTISIWSVSVLTPVGYESLYEDFGFYPIAFVFVASYFTFFLCSKIFLKPSTEELSDDTSYFSLFSACGRKEMRSWISIGLGAFHTLSVFLYLVNKDTNWIGIFE